LLDKLTNTHLHDGTSAEVEKVQNAISNSLKIIMSIAEDSKRASERRKKTFQHTFDSPGAAAATDSSSTK
jgi:hypothetical protein